MLAPRTLAPMSVGAPISDTTFDPAAVGMQVVLVGREAQIAVWMAQDTCTALGAQASAFLRLAVDPGQRRVTSLLDRARHP
jgi:hypothetical protein